MATVVSLTEAKIRQLLSGLESIGLTQHEINAILTQIASGQSVVSSAMDELTNVILPSIREEVSEASSRVTELVDVTLPNLQSDLENATSAIEDVTTVDIPSLYDGLTNGVDNLQARPKVFVQPDEPPAYDDLEERDLVVGDTWFDSDDNNKQRIWNGVEWTTFGVDIPDFSLNVRKFFSGTHMIY